MPVALPPGMALAGTVRTSKPAFCGLAIATRASVSCVSSSSVMATSAEATAVPGRSSSTKDVVQFVAWPGPRDRTGLSLVKTMFTVLVTGLEVSRPSLASTCTTRGAGSGSSRSLANVMSRSMAS